MRLGRIFNAIALVVLAAATMFAQDGRTKVNFYNQTSSTLRFMLNGRPACTGNVIPNGSCTESVNPGAYTASATNGQQTTGGQSFDIAYGETYNYRVFEQSTRNVNPDLYRTVANLDYHTGFTVNAPVELKTDGPKDSTTDFGKPFTQTLYVGELANSDAYMVSVCQYPFAVTNEDLARGLEGFRNGTKSKVLSQHDVTVSGQPAVAATLEGADGNRTLRFGVLLTYKGNKAFIFAFATYLDTPDTDMAAMKTFFTSASLN